MKNGYLQGYGVPMPWGNPVSGDGRFVVFRTFVSTVVPGDTNGFDDIFVRDRLTNQTTRVNVSSTGEEANGHSDYPSISGDGRFVTFASEATNLVAGDTNDKMDIFVHDLLDHTTSLVSLTSSDAQLTNISSFSAIAAGGRYVAFISAAWDLAPNLITNGQLYLRDRDVDGDGIFNEPGDSRTTIISVADDGTPANSTIQSPFDITPDGRFVAFASYASNLVPGDTNGSLDVFVRDLQAGHIWRASVASDGTPTPAGVHSTTPSLSADGRYVSFDSGAATLVANDTNNTGDVFVHDSQTGETTRVSVATGGAQSLNGGSSWSSISDDGRYVAFQSTAWNFGGVLDHVNAYVHDRQLVATTLVSKAGNGFDLGAGTQPSLSGDGSTVVFSAGSTDYTDLYAAVDFSTTPATLSLDANGTAQTLTVTTTPVTNWTAVAGQSWITVTDGGPHAGNATLQVSAAPNTATTQRIGHVVVGTKSVTVKQAGVFSVQTISPTSGKATGGTTATITGSAFTEGAAVRFGGVPAVTTFVDSTKLTARVPPHAVGSVDVEVTNGDGLVGVLTGAYTYTDATGPVVQATVTGTLGPNGWYIDDVVVTWSVTDPESAITSTSNCEPRTVNDDTDPPGTYFWCMATSAGGTVTGISPTIKRDAIRPWVTFDTQASTIYEPGQNATVSYTCNEMHGSGIDTCVGTVPSGGTIDTSTPGMHEVTVTATDKAGWSRASTLTYGVASGVCTPPPSDMVSWWNGDYTMADSFGTNHGSGSATYGYGLVGTAFQFSGTSTNAINFGASPSLKMTTAFSVSAWVYPTGSRFGTIFDKRGEYGLEIMQGNLNYYFGAGSGAANFVLGANTWTHVAMTYDAGALTIYVNGLPVKTATVPATLVDAVPGTDNFMVGAKQTGTLLPISGNIDEVQVYRRALTPAELESMFLSGRRGVCVPAVTSLTVSPVSRTYTSDPEATATLTARLTSGGAGVSGRTLAFSLAGAQVGTAVTDSAGNASITVNVANKNAGTHWITVTHQRDTSYAASNGSATMTIAKRPTTIVWPTPAPITYGTPLDSGMFNATTTEPVNGSFAYTPSTVPSTPPNAGTVTLSTTFTPSDTINYLPKTASVTVQVLKAAPRIMFLNLGPYTYDAQTHVPYAYARGARGDILEPVTVTYNGSSTLPLNAGDYTVEASVPATQNHTAGSATATLTIRKRTPAVSVGTPTGFFTYDGLPHSATGTAYGLNETLTPVTVTYNGQTEPPVNAGIYNLAATYEGSQNYESRTATGVMEIRKADVTLSASIGPTIVLYNGAPRSIESASATGVGGVALPFTVTYNGNSSPPVNAGVYTVIVTYEGSQNYAAKSYSAGTLEIAKMIARFTITGGATSVPYDGSPHGVTATAAGVLGEELTPVTITYNGSTTVPTNAGTYNVVVSYAGSANYRETTGGTYLIIAKRGSQLSWNAPQPLVYGQPLGPAQLKAAAPIPGTFTYSPAAGTVPHRGNLTLQATFTPDDTTNYDGGTITQTVSVLPAPLGVKANDAVKAFGDPLPLFTASFAGFVNGDSPASLAGTLGFGTTATNESPVGGYPITIGGLSSNDYTISFLPGVLTVQPAATSTAVSSSANPSGVNQPVTFTASVSAAASAPGQPTGTVTFRNGSTMLGDAVVQNGTASLTTILATGTHAITAAYSGDTSFAASSSTSLSQTVNTSSTSTTATVTSSRNPSKTGQSVTLTGRVTSPAGTPAGSVQFLAGDVVIGAGTLNGSGQATLTTTTLAVGSHPITVRYLGSATMPPGLSATLVQVVNTSSGTTKSTTTTLSASPSTGSYGTQTTFSVTVSPPLLNSAPTGNVLFMIDGGSSTVVALTTSNGKGIAALSTATLPRGKHLVTVTYLGSGTYAGSTATLTYTVN